MTRLSSRRSGSPIVGRPGARRCDAIACTLVLMGAFCAAAPLTTPEVLEADFRRPPESARPQVWWHWINGNVTKEGISADLQAMKRVGLGGATIFDVGLFDSYNKGQSITIPPGPVKYNSPQWRALVLHAAREARRLGMELGIHNSCGWSSSGGPWVKPDDGLKMVVFTETQLTGPASFAGKLPVADLRHDLAVFAYPTAAPGAGTDQNRSPIRLDQWLYGLGGPAGDYGFPTTNAYAVRRSRLIDLTARMQSDGTLTWEVPPGNWTILRIGYKPTGAGNRASTASGSGREVDKLSRECFDRFWEGGLAPLIKSLGPLAGTTLTTALIDSYEPWYTNWTTNLRDEFCRRRGYDPMPYLIALTGLIVENADVTERFLFDFRTTLAELFAQNYSARMAERLHEHGMKLAIEPVGIGNFNFFTYAKPAGLIMGEFWFKEDQPHWCVKMASSAVHVYGGREVGAESLTSLPESDAWKGHPFLYKPYVDRAFGLGINKLMFHSYAHQPWVSRVLPGMTMGPFGSNIVRTQTWWELSSGWNAYLARCQYLLRAGRFVADVCLFVGEHNPLPSRDAFENLLPRVPSGYDFDYCGPDMLTKAQVRNGQVVLPTGMTYRVLALPNTDRMTPALVRKIGALVRAGATVVGPRPSRSPSLADLGAGDAEVSATADEIWGDCDGKARTVHRLGKGQVVWGRPIAEVFAQANVGPDFQCDSKAVNWIHRRWQAGDLYFVSSFQQAPAERLCTFRIQGRKPELWHPDTGVIKDAAVWRSVPGGVQVPLRFDPAGSVFVVFRKPARDADHPVRVVPARATGTSRVASMPAWELRCDAGRTILRTTQSGRYVVQTAWGRRQVVDVCSIPSSIEIAGPWRVTFPRGWDAPDGATFDTLISWTERPEFGIRYFSGTATYKSGFTIPRGLHGPGRGLTLDLGAVREIAQVKLNGRDLGVLWKPPFRVDVTNAVQVGANALEVKVTNVWVNRLVGDEQFPDDMGWTGRDGYDGGTLSAWPDWFVKDLKRPEPRRKTFVTWQHNGKNSPLVPSGLLGPVVLRPIRVIGVIMRTQKRSR